MERVVLDDQLLTPRCMQCSYNDCMPAITVRNVPDATRDELAARAARSGRSLQEYLRQTLVELATQPDIDDLLDQIRAVKASTGSTLRAGDILAMRDDGRR